MIVATALVLMMTIPGLALFYSGMVRKKDVLATRRRAAAVAMISILGWPLLFAGVRRRRSVVGLLDRWFLAGMTMDSTNPAAEDDPGSAVHAQSDDVCDHHRGAVAGAVADRMRFSPICCFRRWFIVCLCSAGAWIWGGGFLATMGVPISPAASWCISAPASAPGRGQGDGPPSWLWQRKSVAVEPVAGGGRHRFVVAGWFGFQRRIGAGRPIPAR